MRGGHARSGPAPVPGSAASERRRETWTVLPAAGYRGRLPAFPLEGVTDAERALWKVVWRKPQAVEWVRLGLRYQVAAYVRAFLQAAEPGANAAMRTATLRMEDSLGISAGGMRALRWRVDEARPEVSERSAASSIRRLRALPPSGSSLSTGVGDRS